MDSVAQIDRGKLFRKFYWGAFIGVVLATSPSLCAYSINLSYLSLEPSRIEATYKTQVHIKDIELDRRKWTSSDGKSKEARLIEIIGPNKVRLEMKSPKYRGIYNKYTLDTSMLAEVEQEYVEKLYRIFKCDYFISYTYSEGTKIESDLQNLQQGLSKYNSQTRSIEQQREAVLSAPDVKVDVTIGQTYGGVGYPNRSINTRNTSKGTKAHDEQIDRLSFKRQQILNQITHTKQKLDSLLKVNKMAKQELHKVMNPKSNQPTNPSKGRASKRDDKAELRELKEFYKEGLISKEVYESKQRDIIERSND